MGRKPKVFIGSSSESLRIAQAVISNLDHTCELSIWTQGTFDLSDTTTNSLVNKAKSVDFSIFIFSPDDLSTIREEHKKVVRDNVIFELGLFIGTIGLDRCYIVKPRKIDLHLPTDLVGITTTDYESGRVDGDIESALVYPCTQIQKEIDKLGLIEVNNVKAPQPLRFEFDRSLKQIDFDILYVLLSTHTETPGGYALNFVKNSISNLNWEIDISIIKLGKLGYIQKANSEDLNGDLYYVYSITHEGINALLEQEKNSEIIPVSDDDLPF